MLPVPTVTAPPNEKLPPLPPGGTVFSPLPIVMLASDTTSPTAPFVVNAPSAAKSRSDCVLAAAPSIGPVMLIVPPWPRPPLADSPTVEPLLSPFGTWRKVMGPPTWPPDVTVSLMVMVEDVC